MPFNLSRTSTSLRLRSLLLPPTSPTAAPSPPTAEHPPKKPTRRNGQARTPIDPCYSKRWQQRTHEGRNYRESGTKAGCPRHGATPQRKLMLRRAIRRRWQRIPSGTVSDTLPTGNRGRTGGPDGDRPRDCCFLRSVLHQFERMMPLLFGSLPLRLENRGLQTSQLRSRGEDIKRPRSCACLTRRKLGRVRAATTFRRLWRTAVAAHSADASRSVKLRPAWLRCDGRFRSVQSQSQRR